MNLAKSAASLLCMENSLLFRRAIALLIFVFLIIYSSYPIVAFPHAGHDDGLFFRAMKGITQGEWLGSYDNRTLVKGPLLSMVGAFSASIGVHAKLLEACIYSLMVALLAWSARRIGLNKTLVLVLVFLLVANPYLWSFPGRRYLRETLFASLAIGIFALTLMALREKEGRKGAFFAFCGGSVAGGLYLTREEDIWWIAFTIFTVVLALILLLIREGKRSLFSHWKAVGVRLLCLTIGIGSVIGPVLILNKIYYDRPIVSEFRAPEFKEAIGALMRVGDIHPSGYVPVSQAAMQAVFKSVGAASPLSEYWPTVLPMYLGASASALIRSEQAELAGGWFVWALRDAAAAAGKHNSAQQARQFYSRLGAEVNAACEQGILACRTRRDTLAPELTVDRFPDLIAASWRALLYSVSLSSTPVSAPRSSSERAHLEEWAQLIGPVVEEEKFDSFSISGWLAHPSVEPMLSPIPASSLTISLLKVSAAPDVIAYYHAKGVADVRAIRFHMIFECLYKGCEIAIIGNDNVRPMLSLDSPTQGLLPLESPFWGHLDVVSPSVVTTLTPHPLESLHVTIASTLAMSARIITLFLCMVATLGLAIYLCKFQRVRRADWLFTLTVGAAIAVLGRCIIIGYIDITSWRAVNAGYLGAAYPFVIAYAVFGSGLFLRAFGIRPNIPFHGS